MAHHYCFLVASEFASFAFFVQLQPRVTFYAFSMKHNPGMKGDPGWECPQLEDPGPGLGDPELGNPGWECPRLEDPGPGLGDPEQGNPGWECPRLEDPELGDPELGNPGWECPRLEDPELGSPGWEWLWPSPDIVP